MLLPGCGSGGTAAIENPLGFFKQAQESIETDKSYRMKGSIVSAYSFDGEDMAMNIDADAAYEMKSDGEMMIEMVMDMELAGEEYEVLVYIAGDRYYMERPGVGWVYQELTALSGMENMGQGMGATNMMEVLEQAESAEVVARTASPSPTGWSSTSRSSCANSRTSSRA